MQDSAGARGRLWGVWGWVLWLWHKNGAEGASLPPQRREGLQDGGKELPSEVQEAVELLSCHRFEGHQRAP